MTENHGVGGSTPPLPTTRVRKAAVFGRGFRFCLSVGARPGRSILLVRESEAAPMSDEASFHDGYVRALEDLSKYVERLRPSSENLEELQSEISARIVRARCSERSSLASHASGDTGY